MGTDPQGNEAVWFLNIVDYLVLFFFKYSIRVNLAFLTKAVRDKSYYINSMGLDLLTH